MVQTAPDRIALLFDGMFKFKPGDVVIHKAEAETRLVIIERVLSQDANGFIGFYTLSLLTITNAQPEAQTVMLPESALKVAN